MHNCSIDAWLYARLLLLTRNFLTLAQEGPKHVGIKVQTLARARARARGGRTDRQHSEFFTAVLFIEYARRFDIVRCFSRMEHHHISVARWRNWRLIGRRGQVERPPRSPDLGAPPDYFVRGNSKYFVYLSCQRTIHDLKISVLLLERSHLRVSNVRGAVWSSLLTCARKRRDINFEYFLR
jgi:hypothetical protein